MISGNLNTAATQSGVGGISGGGGSGHHNVYVIGNGELPPIPPAVFTPPIEDINPMETAQNELLTSLGVDESSEAGQWVNNNDNFLEVLEINKFLNQHTENGVANQEALDLATNIIESYDNGTLVTSFPFFQYPDDGNDYAGDYSLTTAYLSDQIPKSIENSDIVDAIIEITGLSVEDIIADLKWGEGPEIHIQQLDNYTNDGDECTTCNEITAGLFDPNEPNKIFLDIDLVNKIENGELTAEESNNLQLFFVSTVLHEYVHLGVNENEVTYTTEDGDYFELKVWGREYVSGLRKFYVRLIQSDE